MPKMMKIPSKINITGTIIPLYFSINRLKAGRAESLWAIKHHITDIIPNITSAVIK